MPASPPRPTRRQYRLARLITRWYLDRYYGTQDDVGGAAMFCDPDRVGHFAVTPAALRRGDGAALFRVLIATTMFQRRQDVQIMRVLRGTTRDDADELTDHRKLLELATESRCPNLSSNAALLGQCDLGKDPVTKVGFCGERPRTRCHLKHHTVVLKRYGHFGKVPTSAALMLRENGANDLAALRETVLRANADPLERALELERRLCQAWRVSDKIAAMFLSAISNPDLSPGLAPWTEGIDWRRFIVIDSNVDLFLKATGYPGPWTYDARRVFVAMLASRIDVSEGRRFLHAYNPRIIQQALYLFMSSSNRRSAERDCVSGAPATCARCALRTFCPLAPTS